MIPADSVTIESDEGIWLLVITDGLGEKHTFGLSGAAAWDFLDDAGLAALKNWRAQAERVRDEYFAARSEGSSVAAAFESAMNEDAAHEESVYALDDPKHPTYRERMSDLAD